VTRPPDFDELVPDVESPEEGDRLRRVHELLIQAGPPPELSPTLASSPETPATGTAAEEVTWLPRRRLRAGLVLAFAVVAAAFGIGYLAGADDDEAFSAERVVVMRGTDLAPAARASIRLGKADGGNIPMVLTVAGLRRLDPEGYYEVLLTRNGEVVGPCGTFVVRGEDRTTVYLNAPYRVDRTTGWIVAVHPTGHVDDPEPVLTT
jgi:hypothetical protein